MPSRQILPRLFKAFARSSVVLVMIMGYISSENRLHGADEKGALATKSMSASFVTSMDLLNDTQKLGPGDELSFRVIEDEDPPRVLKVTDTGEMEVPYLGRLNVAGKSCKTLAYEIKAALEKEYYIQASVILGLDTIAPKGMVSRGRIHLTGAIRTQGPQEIPADEEFTVSKAVMRAGGFAEYANRRKVRLTRKTGTAGATETIVIDLIEVLEKGKVEKDVVVLPEDKIFVPEKWFNF